MPPAMNKISVTGSIARQQFSSKKMEPSSTALIPMEMRLLRQIASRPIKTAPPIKQLPIMIKVS